MMQAIEEDRDTGGPRHVQSSVLDGLIELLNGPFGFANSKIQCRNVDAVLRGGIRRINVHLETGVSSFVSKIQRQ